MRPSIIILTYNSELSIGETLRSVTELSDDIHVVDSGSSDHTVPIARSFAADVVEHVFENYGSQRNWAMSSLVFKYQWQLHLDADERLTAALVQEIAAMPEDGEFSGVHIPRMMVFLGKQLRHGGMSPTWHMRLFRSGSGRCEARKYDQHFYVTGGRTGKLKAHMIDEVRMPLSEWTFRHNRWSDAEVEELDADVREGRIKARPFGDPVERKRYLRGIYNGAPLFVRPFLLFFYRYFLRLGILDGPEGLIFWVLQTFWFRFLVDAKMFERRNAQRARG